MPDIVISALAGAILAVVVYGIIAGLGSVLFKRTAQQSSGPVRLVYGLSGAFVGLLFGAFFIWLILVGIRSIGSIAEAQVQAKPANAEDSRRESDPLRKIMALPSPTLDADSFTTLLARLKNSVELGTAGGSSKKPMRCRPVSIKR